MQILGVAEKVVMVMETLELPVRQMIPVTKLMIQEPLQKELVQLSHWVLLLVKTWPLEPLTIR